MRGWLGGVLVSETTRQTRQSRRNSISAFGAALKQMLDPFRNPNPNPNTNPTQPNPTFHLGFTTTGTFECGNDTSKNFLELDLSKSPSGSVKFNAVMLRENMTTGQTITGYAIDYKDAQGDWVPFPMCSGGQCRVRVMMRGRGRVAVGRSSILRLG